MKIGVLTSGGDSPGMNSCIANIVRMGADFGHTIYAFKGGYSGIYNKQYTKMEMSDINGLYKLGGTVIKSGRMPKLKDESIAKKLIDILVALNIGALIVLGGDGTLRGANILSKVSSNQVNIIGIPCTIDNNIYGSDYSIGHDTAINKLVAYIDDITDTGMSMNKRIFLVETLGGLDGFFPWYPYQMGIVDFPLISEKPMSDDEVVEKINAIFASGVKDYVIITVAEYLYRTALISEYIEKKTGIQPKCNYIGYQQRGGSPTAADRIHAAEFAEYAIYAINNNILNKYIAYKDGQYTYLDFLEANNKKRFDPGS